MLYSWLLCTSIHFSMGNPEESIINQVGARSGQVLKEFSFRWRSNIEHSRWKLNIESDLEPCKSAPQGLKRYVLDLRPAQRSGTKGFCRHIAAYWEHMTTLSPNPYSICHNSTRRHQPFQHWAFSNVTLHPFWYLLRLRIRCEAGSTTQQMGAPYRIFTRLFTVFKTPPISTVSKITEHRPSTWHFEPIIFSRVATVLFPFKSIMDGTFTCDNQLGPALAPGLSQFELKQLCVTLCLLD